MFDNNATYLFDRCIVFIGLMHPTYLTNPPFVFIQLTHPLSVERERADEAKGQFLQGDSDLLTMLR